MPFRNEVAGGEPEPKGHRSSPNQSGHHGPWQRRLGLLRRRGFLALMLGVASCVVKRAPSFADRVLGTKPDWYLPLSETAGEIAFAYAGPDGTYQNNPQLGVAPIARHDIFGHSVGLSGVTQDTPHITAQSPLSSSDITIDMIVQLDDLTRPKHVLLTTLGGTVAGQFSIEVLEGGQPRAWSTDQSTFYEIVGSVGDVPQGTAVKITYQRQSGVAPSQRLLVNGVVKAQDPTARTWDPVPPDTVYIGTWIDTGTGAFLAPTDGLVAHVAGWDRYLGDGEIASLVRVQDVAWAEDIDAGSVQQGATKEISVLQGGWHGKTPVTVTAGDGSLVTTTEEGDQITILAGDAIGDGSIFTYSFTDAKGKISPTRTVTIDVVGAPAGVWLPAPLAAFEHTRVRVTNLANWSSGRTPKEVASQGALAHAYVRRAWKPTDNDGTWMDFQAGWRNGTGDSVAIKLDDGSLLNISFDVTNAIPSPGPGGTTRTLDKLGGGNFTTWTAAIAACSNNDVLVMRARSGGEVYPVDVNVGGAVSAKSGVTVVAHPDDIAAGRRPRIHQQGSTFARYADDLNNGHWEVYQALGGAHGTVHRTTQAVGTNKINIGCSYRTTSGKIKRCYTYTNTPGASSTLALDRLTDTTYPRISKGNKSTWGLYMGPGIYLHSDGKLYIRLTPLSNGIGARQVQTGQGVGDNPPFDWADDNPANTNPNNCQLYISSTNDYNSEGATPTTGLSYCLRINNTANWTIENVDFVGGGNAIEANNCGENGPTLRGVRFLGWAPPNMASEDNTASTVDRIHNMIEGETTHNILFDRCEFWGGMPPWSSWEENKAQWGAYSVAHKANLWWMADGTSDSFSATFRHCLLDGFALINRRGGKLRFTKFHHCRLAYCGFDGLIASEVPSQTHEFIRTQMIESSFGGWIDEDDVAGVQYVGNCLIVRVRPYGHDVGYWDAGRSQACQFFPINGVLGHGVTPGWKNLESQYWYQNTSIGSQNMLRESARKFGSNMSHDGTGAGIFPYGKNDLFVDWYSRNNVCAVVPNNTIGDGANTRVGTGFGDSHVSVVMHQAIVGNGDTKGGISTLNVYSSDYNIYYKHPGMPTLGGTSFNGVITTVNSGGSEQARTTIGQVQSDTGQEMHGRFTDPLFVGSWDYTKRDSEVHDNAFWMVGGSSPTLSGGDETNRAWLDVDYGTETTYPGHAWLGCMDPDASAVEQQVGPLGPTPSGL